MDVKAKDIIGLPVLTYNRGTKIYDVEDLIVDPEQSQVLALVVSERMLFHPAKAIPFGRINAIGPDAVIVPDGKAVIDVNRDPVLKRLDNDQKISGLRVLTEDGRKLGEVDDMLVDDKTGEIKGYYVSLGRGLNLGQGLRWLPANRVARTGMRVLYVPPEVAQDFDQQSGGVSGALDQAGGKLRTAGAKLNQQLEEAGAKLKSSGAQLNQQLEQVGTQVRQTVPERAGQMAVGRTAHNAVTASDGTVIVNEGDVVTQEQVDAARDAGRLTQLLMAVGAGPTRTSANTLGEQANQSLSDIQDEARSLWGQLTGGYNRTVDQADDRMMQRRIKYALGRPVTRVILDNDDSVILNTGEIITNRAIDEARAAGVLDVLVDSVYSEKPQLTLDDMKAPEGGDASLQKERATTGTGAGKARSKAHSAQDTAELPAQH